MKNDIQQVYYNAKTKIYKDGSTNTIVSRAPCFKDDIEAFIARHQSEYENSQNILAYLEAQQEISDRELTPDQYVTEKYENKKMRSQYRSSEYLHFASNRVENVVRGDSLKRAKDKIFDYIHNNDFEWFFTGTINPEKLDSLNPSELLKPVQNWLKNMRRNYGLEYIFIPELHPSSGRIHFHGLMTSSKPLNLIDSGHKTKSGQTIFNLKSWDFGFTTCIATYGANDALGYYVSKYVTKDTKKIFGKFYWHSRGLSLPSVLLSDIDFESVDSLEHHGFKYIYEVSQNEGD